MKNKFIAMLFAALLCFTGATVHAQSTETITVTPQPSASRTISTAGSGHVVDNITDTDSEKIQFITVTAKDGSVFYVVIDKQNSNDNVYFLNSVDVSDLEALTENYTPKAAAVSTPSPTPTPSAQETSTEKKDTADKSSGNNTVLIIILVLAAVGIGGGYYVKVILPKKKLEDADDLEDFDFEDESGADDAEEYGEDDISDDDTEDDE